KETVNKMTYQQWHEALGHPSPKYLNSTHYSDTPTISSIPKGCQCETCITSKSTKYKLKSINYSEQSKIPFELIHSYLHGKFSKSSFSNAWYYVMFIDNCTRYTWIYPLRAKSDTIKVFTQLIQERQTQDSS